MNRATIKQFKTAGLLCDGCEEHVATLRVVLSTLAGDVLDDMQICVACVPDMLTCGTGTDQEDADADDDAAMTRASADGR